MENNNFTSLSLFLPFFFVYKIKKMIGWGQKDKVVINFVKTYKKLSLYVVYKSWFVREWWTKVNLDWLLLYHHGLLNNKKLWVSQLYLLFTSGFVFYLSFLYEAMGDEFAAFQTIVLLPQKAQSRAGKGTRLPNEWFKFNEKK